MYRVGKVIGGKQIIKDITLGYYYGAKIGVLGLNGSGKSTLLKIMAGLDQDYLGEVNMWKKHLARLAGKDGPRFYEYLLEAVRSLDETNNSRRKKVLPLLIRLLVGETQESSRLPIALGIMSGTARQMLFTIKDLYGPLVQLPSRASLDKIRDSLRIHFMNTWKLGNIPNGMRVSLVEAIL